MADDKPKQNLTWPQAVGALAAIAGGVYYFQIAPKQQMADIENQVATDAVKQYEIAKRQGDAMQTCVQAGMVSTAFLQAKNEAQYTQWKATEKADCARAGVPH